MTYQVRNLSISISKRAKEVYQFASQQINFTQLVAFINSMNKEENNT